MTKKELRQLYKKLRRQLSKEAIEEKSISIANLLLTLPIWDKMFYHIFLSIEEQNEVATESILTLLAAKDKNVVVAAADFESRKMTNYLLTDSTKIKKNHHNIPEPIDGIEVPINKIQVVFVPLLAFDIKGNRVGYGKGFYDAFLRECTPEVIKIGLSFFEAESNISDVWGDDIALDFCVTPKIVYRF